MEVTVTYLEVYERVESLLLAMVVDGRAAFRGSTGAGVTFIADADELSNRIADSGLDGDNVPWSFVVDACIRLRRGTP